MTALPGDVERLALLGWKLTPMVCKSRCGYFRGYLDLGSSDLRTLEGWFNEYPGCNWAVVASRSGVWALDVDIPGPDHAHDGVAALRGLVERHGALPPRPHGRSGGGGHLLVFRATAPIVGGSGKPAPGLDVLAGKTTFTVAPSRHHRTGNLYRWTVPPWEVEPPEAPPWLLSMLAPPPPPPRSIRHRVVNGDRAWWRLNQAVDTVLMAAPGSRNATLNRECWIVGGYVGAGLLGEGDATRALYAAAIAAGLSHPEARATIASGLADGLARPLDGGAVR